MIKLENLTKQFVQKKGQPLKAVDNVNLNVPEGEMCVLLGPSGCGKTTTLKMINRLIAPSSGNILINGENRGLTLSGTKTHVKQRFLPLTPLLMVS
ncbi:ATP-binding cassette domain-containing protein, partial [Salmonella enterica]|uniref:ATP-binding cassette domain-containing protein n=1 Tax=Salmonella enterica TaxID=28901 RepID=UPI000799DEC5